MASDNRLYAPLYRDSFSLCQWLLNHWGDDPRILPRQTCETALRLHDALILAIKDRDRDERIDLADEALIHLRTRIRLAGAVGYLTQEQMYYAMEQADTIGRQLGGWLRSLEAP